MSLLSRIREKSYNIISDPHYSHEHPLKHHIALATISTLGLGQLHPEDQIKIANHCNIKEGSFTKYSSIYGGAINVGIYSSMYFGIIKASKEVQMVANLVDSLNLDTACFAIGTTMVTLNAYRLISTMITKKPAFPVIPKGLIVVSGVAAAKRGYGLAKRLFPSINTLEEIAEEEITEPTPHTRLNRLEEAMDYNKIPIEITAETTDPYPMRFDY